MIPLPTTSYWHTIPITYNQTKYFHEENSEINEIIHIKEKKTNNTIFSILSPILIDQITENEFITAAYKNKIPDNNFVFQHLYYDNNTNHIKQLFVTSYQSPSQKITTINHLYLLNEYTKTIIYNPIQKKSLILETTNITEFPLQETTPYLKAIINIENADTLTLLINSNTLEFNGFYSNLQDRYIAIKRNKDNNFIDDYNQTLEKEILTYIRILKQQEIFYQEQSNQKAEQILQKYLTKKNKKR